MKMKKSNLIAGLALLSIAATSCTVPKKVAYFQDVTDATVIQLAEERQLKVKPEDKLAIVVKTKDGAISDLFNLPVMANRIGTNGSVNGTSATFRNNLPDSSEGIATYTVDKDGNIDFPVLGRLHIAGMTRAEVAGFVKGELMGRDLVKDPTVIVEFLSTGISVLGEVHVPGRYDVNKDHITILEALALAGDATIDGQRENVKVLRQQDGKIVSYTLDLTDTKQLANSPAFYLEQGDVVYVEPNKMKKRSTTVNGNNALNVSFWITAASLLTSIVTTIVVLTKN